MAADTSLTDNLKERVDEKLETKEKPKKRKGRPRKEDVKLNIEDTYDDIRRSEDIRKDKVNDRIVDEVMQLGLNQKQQDFVLYYLESTNATQAYLKSHGGDKKWAAFYGCNLLHNPKIQGALRKLKKILTIGYDIDPSKYIETQLKIANADIGDYIKFSEEEIPMYNDDGTIMFDPDTGEQKFKKVNRMHLVDSDTVDTSIITSIKQGRDGISIQLPDKMKAWENIKNFFEWKAQKKVEENIDSNILSALGQTAKSSWENEDIDADLKETLKEDI